MSKRWFIRVIIALMVIVVFALSRCSLVSPPPAPSTATATVTVTVKPSPTQDASTYPVHEGIWATVFWVGEDASADNNNIQNSSSFWMDDWRSAFGGVDNPDKRCGYAPCGFVPKENPFYFALPYADTVDDHWKPQNQLRLIPWYNPKIQLDPATDTWLKNRWIEVTYLTESGEVKTVYSQWEDVGPFGEDDWKYVLGLAPPQEHAGLDLSPAAADYLGIGGRDGGGMVSWRFIDRKDVPDGPWLDTVTNSPPKWG